MSSPAITVDQYMAELPEERKPAMNKLRELFKANLPQGFEECMSYGMIGYVVPHSIYPKGYHCTPKLPLPFINIGSKKNNIALHHMGMVDPKILDWFTDNYPKDQKLDMGVGCIRFKKMDKIPFSLLEELAKKISPTQWIEVYENKYLK
jgi:Domain of unknown function (DU1801)